MMSVTRSAEGASSEPRPPARFTVARSAPCRIASVSSPFLASTSIASAACWAVNAVEAPVWRAASASRSSAAAGAFVTASTRFIAAWNCRPTSSAERPRATMPPASAVVPRSRVSRWTAGTSPATARRPPRRSRAARSVA